MNNVRNCKYFPFLFLLPALLIFISCRNEAYRYSRPVLGTIGTITIMAESPEVAMKAAEAAFDEIVRVEKLMSPYIEGSDVWRINREAATAPVQVSADTLTVLSKSMEVSEASGGAFDVSFAPLGEIWNYKNEPFSPPTGQLVAMTKKLVNYRNIVLDSQNRSVRLLMNGMRIGLGAIAKGYAVGRAMAVLRSMGIVDCIVEIGGDLQVSGSKNGERWVTGLRHPRKEGILAAVTMKSGEAVVTSGDYERKALFKGKRYHHIIDPRTGNPTETFESVTVICADPMEADAYATALFVLGPKGYRDFCEKKKGISVVLIDLDGKVVMSESLKGRVQFFEKVDEMFF